MPDILSKILRGVLVAIVTKNKKPKAKLKKKLVFIISGLCFFIELKKRINKDIRAGAAQLALALTKTLSTKTIIIIGKEKLSKYIFSKSILKFLILIKKPTKRTH